MPSCLGLYIENNLIKYAKVSKEREAIKVEAFGIKFYDKLNEAIKQIISETYSFKIPISVNLSQEMYNYFYMFSLINKKDMQKAVETEFSSYCTDQGINENSLVSRYVLVNSFDDKEKIKKAEEEISKQWEEMFSRLAYYIEHEELEKFSKNLENIKTYIRIEKYEEAIKEIREGIFILNHIEDKYSFNLQNIF